MKILLAFILTSMLLNATNLENCSSVDIQAKRIYGASPATNYLLYSFEPSLMTGLNFKLWEYEEQYMTEVKSLPVVGGWFGQGSTANLEMVAKLNPDLIIFWNHRKQYEKIVNILDKLKIPSCYMDLDTLDDYPAAYRTLGKISGNFERAEELATDFDSRLKRLRAIAAKKKAERKVTIYYAQGNDGLTTECHNSLHSEIIRESGAFNVYRCAKNAPYGKKQITAEKLLVLDPDMVIVYRPSFYRNIKNTTQYKLLRAYREGNYHMIPRIPFNWIDRPNSFMRVLGFEWLLTKVYPELDLDIVAETKKFYKLYLRRDLSDSDVESIFTQSAFMKEKFKKKKKKKQTYEKEKI